MSNNIRTPDFYLPNFHVSNRAHFSMHSSTLILHKRSINVFCLHVRILNAFYQNIHNYHFS